MPEEKKLTEATEQPQEQENPEAAGVPPVSTSHPTSSETDTLSPQHKNVETDRVECEIVQCGHAPLFQSNSDIQVNNTKIAPGQAVLSEGEAVIFGEHRRIVQGMKARNADGTVNYTRIDLI